MPAGQTFTALNGGLQFKFSEVFQVMCDTQLIISGAGSLNGGLRAVRRSFRSGGFSWMPCVAGTPRETLGPRCQRRAGSAAGTAAYQN